MSYLSDQQEQVKRTSDLSEVISMRRSVIYTASNNIGNTYQVYFGEPAPSLTVSAPESVTVTEQSPAPVVQAPQEVAVGVTAVQAEATGVKDLRRAVEVAYDSQQTR